MNRHVIILNFSTSGLSYQCHVLKGFSTTSIYFLFSIFTFMASHFFYGQFFLISFFYSYFSVMVDIILY